MPHVWVHTLGGVLLSLLGAHCESKSDFAKKENGYYVKLETLQKLTGNLVCGQNERTVNMRAVILCSELFTFSDQSDLRILL